MKLNKEKAKQQNYYFDSVDDVLLYVKRKIDDILYDTRFKEKQKNDMLNHAKTALSFIEE